MNELMGSLLEDKSYSSLLLASLNLVKQDLYEFLDAYIKDGQISVYAKQPTAYKNAAVLKHPQYLSHFIDRDEDSEYLIATFAFPPKCRKFLENLENTELPLEELWIQLFKELD